MQAPNGEGEIGPLILRRLTPDVEEMVPVEQSGAYGVTPPEAVHLYRTGHLRGEHREKRLWVSVAGLQSLSTY